MALPDHTGVAETLSIYIMVINRLPFLDDTQANTTHISELTVEFMEELELCYKIKEAESPNNTIGPEDNYSVVQRSILADLVAMTIIYNLMATTTAGGTIDSYTTTTPAGGKVLTKAKAGSVETGWERLDITKNATLGTTGEKLLNMLKSSAIRKAFGLGCIIDICDTCTIAVSCLLNIEPASFKINDFTLCESTETNPVERG